MPHAYGHSDEVPSLAPRAIQQDDVYLEQVAIEKADASSAVAPLCVLTDADEVVG